MKIYVIIILNIFFIANIFAQSKKPIQFLGYEPPRNYDVIKYDLFVDWVNILPSTKQEPWKRQWNAKLKIILTPLENNLSAIELDAVELKINKIWIDNNELVNVPSNTSGILKVPVPTIYIGDTLLLQIDYTYNNQYNIGFLHRNSLDNYEANIKFGIDIPMAGTLSEPQDARYWLPCNDRPNDKALVSIACNVPHGMLVASNGKLDSTAIVYENSFPDSEIFYWTSAHPMSPYLMTIATTEYELHIEKVPTSSANTDSVDIYYYTWRNEWKGNGDYNLSRFATNISKTMQIFGDLFGDYPFEKYGIAAMDYTLIGKSSLGMEHQTLTTICSNWFETYVPIPEFPSFAHELAHSWFGNLVTCYSWRDIWFQEGGASWLEALYLENIKENKIDTFAYYNHIINHRSAYLGSKSKYFELALYLDEDSDPFLHSALIYSKAAWVFHQLRMLLGKNVFVLLKKILQQYEYGTITSQAFVDFFVDNVPNPPSGIDMKRFIEQFVFKAGHPIYNITSNVITEEGKSNVHILLEQTQKANNVPEEFLMNLNIQFFNSNGEIIHSEFIINDKRQQEYSFQLSTTPSKIILDSSKALFEINSNVLIDNIEPDDVWSGILIYPNPANTGRITVQFNANATPTNWNLQIDMVDMLGNVLPVNIAQISNNFADIDISNIVQGIYFLQINGSNICKIVVNE